MPCNAGGRKNGSCNRLSNEARPYHGGGEMKTGRLSLSELGKTGMTCKNEALRLPVQSFDIPILAQRRELTRRERDREAPCG